MIKNEGLMTINKKKLSTEQVENKSNDLMEEEIAIENSVFILFLQYLDFKNRSMINKINETLE